MHTVIVGVGGVGGYYGGKMIQSGQKVSMIARGAHLQAIKNKGLQIHSIDGDFLVHPLLVTDSVAAIDKADLILICTKSWQIEEAAKSIRPLLKENTVVIPLQNGADNAQRLLSVLDSKYVVGGLCKIYSKIEAPGIISHFGHPPELIFGELDGTNTDRLASIKQLFDRAGFRGTIAKNIHVDIWGKFMFIATVSGLGALTKASIGEMYAHPELNSILRKTAEEIYTIGVAKGVPLSDQLVAGIMDFIAKQPFDSTASTQRDILAGRPSELDNFNGFIVREGKKLGIATPTNSFIYACLQPMEAEARKSLG